MLSCCASRFVILEEPNGSHHQTKDPFSLRKQRSLPSVCGRHSIRHVRQQKTCCFVALRLGRCFSHGRADPARSAHFKNLAARLTHTEVRSRGKCRVLPWLHSLSGDTALAFFDQGRPSRIRPTMIEWLVALRLCGLDDVSHTLGLIRLGQPTLKI